MDSTHSILRSARHFFAGTFLSRISGLGRDMAMAFCFGATPEIAAFMVAYRLANLFRRLLGEGNLQAGFVPHFEAAKAEGRGASFYRETAFSLSLILIAVIIFLEACFWGALQLAQPSWREIIELSMWMIPGLFFICLYALNSSLLQCQRKYFLPAAAPIAFNFIWILAVLLLPRTGAMRGLALAITLAFAAQWAATLFSTKDFFGNGRPQLFSAEWKKLLKPLALGIVGIGAVQFNSALDALFARFADTAGPAFLWYAIRIQQLPLALFGIALSGALLPPLARAKDTAQYQHLLQSALRTSAALMLPCTFGILALGGVGINLLYGHGDFSPSDVRETLLCLWGYGIGLVPSVFVLLLANGFYAQKNYRIPTLASLSSVALNIALNAFFVFGLGWGAISVAIATSLSAFLNLMILKVGLKLPIFTTDFCRFLLRMAFCCALPAAVTAQIEHYWLAGTFPRSFALQAIQLIALSAIYLAGLLLLAWRFRMKELFDLFRRKTEASPKAMPDSSG
ncbi:MAG TPA: murein biosynthesis integral membrane protein MurJ [Chlamydiales bacterium]|nr:murein biosynthesis integral membrane protein MurJ [Chlamydiales bacterium]